MLFKIIADVLVLIHFGFILFVVLGGLMILRYRWLVFAHMPAVVWAILLEFRGWYCPLTAWENHYRRLADQAAYTDGFIEHYLIPLIYPARLTETLQIALGILVFLINALIYQHVIKSLRGRRTRKLFSKKQV